MWRGRHCSHHTAVCSVKHLSTQAMPVIGQGLVGILPHLTTLIIQDLGLVPGSWAGGRTTLGRVTDVYLSTILHLQTMDQV